jgi:hypothetical protein
MTSKWDNPYKVNAFRSASDVLVLYEEHIRNTPRLWQSLYEIDSVLVLGEIGQVLTKLRQEQLSCKREVIRTKPLLRF